LGNDFLLLINVEEIAFYRVSIAVFQAIPMLNNLFIRFFVGSQGSDNRTCADTDEKSTLAGL